MQAEHFYTVEIIPDEDRLSLDRLSTFEIGSILSHRIDQIGKDFLIYIPQEYRYINASTLSSETKQNIPKDNTIKNGYSTFVKLSTSEDIAKCEINTNNIPYNIYRHISTDHKKKIIYAEVVNPNLLSKPVLKYFSNYI